MQDINEIMSRLDWNSCEKDKEIGIKLAQKNERNRIFYTAMQSKI